MKYGWDALMEIKRQLGIDNITGTIYYRAFNALEVLRKEFDLNEQAVTKDLILEEAELMKLELEKKAKASDSSKTDYERTGKKISIQEFYEMIDNSEPFYDPTTNKVIVKIIDTSPAAFDYRGIGETENGEYIIISDLRKLEKVIIKPRPVHK